MKDEKRMPEVDLNSEAAKAATHYTQNQAKHAPTAQKHEILNNVAHGFYMGARWMEKRLGITK